MASIPLPALHVNPPQQQDPMAGIEKLVQLKSLMNQQAIQQQQVQAGGLENQQRQMDLDSQKALQKAYMDANGDPDKTTQLAAKYGAKPQALLQWQNSVLEQKAKTLDLVSKQGDQAKIQADLMQGAHDAVSQAPDAERPAVYQQQLMGLKQRGMDISQFPPQYPGDEMFKILGATVKTHSQMVEEALKAQQGQEAGAKAAEANTQSQIGQQKLAIINQYKQNPQQILSQVDAAAPPDKYGSLNVRTKAMVNQAMSVGDVDGAKEAIKQAADTVNSGEKEVRVAQQTQPLKIETARAEQQASQLIKGMSEPVYAYDQKGQKVLMSKTDALQSGMKTMVPVTEKEIGDDTMLVNRLGDVHQKIARYENAMQKWDMSYNDRAAVQSLLSSDKFKLGAFGAEIPVDSFNKMADQFHVKNLSGPARDALISYYNAREAMVGYNRVLSGSGKSSDKALQLQEETLPDISTADHDMAQRGFRDFKENLNVVGQGLPKLPGVKSPQEWAQGESTNTPTAPAQGGWGAQFGGVKH